MLLSLLALASGLGSASAFYLPGSAPRDYRSGDAVDVFVNTLSPRMASRNRLEPSSARALVSHDYYDERFHFCQPPGGPVAQPESLGSILFGDRILSSPYKIRMLENSTCNLLCKSEIPGDDAAWVNERIQEDYGVNLLIDGLPSSELRIDAKTGEEFLDAQGFALGSYDETLPSTQSSSLNNHYDIFIQYHAKTADTFRVVGVQVNPRSVDSLRDGDSGEPDCFASTPKHLREKGGNQVAYTYSVQFVASSIPWGMRWDSYLHVFDPRIHWFSLINSLVIAGFLVLMVGTILYRTISSDIHRYNAVDLSEDIQEDYGWKLVHGEVFRQPSRPMVLSVFVGNGMHLVAMLTITLVFALFGLLSPSNRGSLATVLIICWTFFACVSGYFSSRVYSTLGGESWKPNLVLTAILFPLITFTLIGLLNLFLISASASGAVPFGTIFVMLFLFVVISCPLSVAGYFYGMRHGPIPQPVRVHPIPRQIPPVQWYLQPIPSAILGGILPFGAAFVELYFVLSSIFGHRAYYAYGFLFLTFGVVSLTTALVSVLFTYFALCAEEYRWHWRAFLVGGGSAAWVFVYGVWYYVSRLSFGGFTSVVLYFGYLFLFCLLDFLVGGAIGYIATYFAVRRLYSSIRVD